MKNIVLTLISMMLGILTIMIGMTLYGRMNRSMELKSNLSSAVEETVECLMTSKLYGIENREEFVAEFVEKLIYALDGKMDIQVDIMQYDMEKGLLAVKVSAIYQLRFVASKNRLYDLPNVRQSRK